MARIAGVDLPRDKRIEIGLTYIYGIGRTLSNEILKETGLNPDKRVKDLTDDEINKLREVQMEKLPLDYSITNWRTTYFKEAATILNESFKNSSDALFDSRFLSVKGCRDILEKITNNIYGDFLPGITKVLIYKKHVIGFCMANLTNNKIANIPVVAILPQHRNKGFGKMLLKQMIDNLITSAISGGWELKELNVSCDSDSLPAVKMYQAIGFKEEYSYPQSYLPKQI